MAVGRKKRISRYLSPALKKAKNLHTRRTRVAIIQRDLRKAGTAQVNKRVIHK